MRGLNQGPQINYSPASEGKQNPKISDQITDSAAAANNAAEGGDLQARFDSWYRENSENADFISEHILFRGGCISIKTYYGRWIEIQKFNLNTYSGFEKMMNNLIPQSRFNNFRRGLDNEDELEGIHLINPILASLLNRFDPVNSSMQKLSLLGEKGIVSFSEEGLVLDPPY